MKAFVSLILCCMLLLTGCNPQQSTMGGSEFSRSSNISIESSKESNMESKYIEDNSNVFSELSSDLVNSEERIYNTAFTTLYPDFVPTDKGLFYVEKLGFQEEVPWNRINQIKNLDRGNYETGAYQIYYLITPIYVGSKIKMYPIDFIQEDPYFIHSELLYESLDTPDDYALLVTSIEPETFYDYELIMGKGEREVSYRFQYDGRGDRPYIEQLGGESRSAFRKFEIVSYDEIFTGLIPYPYGEELPFTIRVYGKSGRYYYDISYLYIGKLPADNPKEIILQDGRTCLYGTNYDSPSQWYYAFPYGEGFIVCSMYHHVSGAYDNGTAPAPWEVSEDFRIFLESLQIETKNDLK